jgi:hypothetical protein
LLKPEVVQAVLDEAPAHPQIGRVLLATNGLGLTADWLRKLRDHPQAVVLLSLDGRPEDHRRHRRGPSGAADAYDHVLSLLDELCQLPRLIVTQTIAPDTAAAAADNFQHLLSLGLRRFKFLPVYYRTWTAAQLEALRDGLAAVAATIRSRWQTNRTLYVRNLFTWAPTPLFNTGLVVDSDRAIHASNAGLASEFAELLDVSRIGSLAQPPTAEAVAAKATEVERLLPQLVPPDIWQSTQAVDEELTRFCRGLYPEFLAYRKRRRDVA